MKNCCNPFETPAWVSEMIQSVINQKIICNEIQAGLLDCEGGVLAPGTHMVRCEELSGLVDEAIKNGDIDIPGIESLEFDGERITLVDQAGKTHQIDIAELAPQSITSNGFEITLTMKNGQEYKVNLETAVEEAIVRKAVKSAVLTKDNILEMTLGDGSKITANLGKLLQEVRVTNGSVDSEGNIQIVLGDGTVIPINAKRLREVVIDRDSALIGNGDDIPLDIDFSRVCWQVIESITMDGEGLHIKIDNQCDAVTLPMKDIAAALKDKVAVCVAGTGYIKGNGTSGNCLDLDLQKIIEALVKDEKVLGTLVNNLHYKVKVKTNGTLSGDGTEKSPLGVQISKGSGNLLTVREDGIYYGQQAAADVSVLYVDSVGGSDANKGTRESPLATLAKAISMVRSDQGNTIRLRCGGEYVWPVMSITGGAYRQIEAYGDPYIDGSKVMPATPEKRVYHWWVRENVVRPKIYYQIGYNHKIRVYNIAYASPSGGGVLVCRGLEFMGSAINDPGTLKAPEGFVASEWSRWNKYGVYGANNGNVVFYGCKFRNQFAPKEAIAEPGDGWETDEEGNIKYPLQSWWGIVGKSTTSEGAQPNFIACTYVNLDENPSQEKFPPDLVGVESGMSTFSVRGYTDSWGSEPGYEYNNQNIGTALRDKGILSGVTRDTNGVPRNVTTNIVL